GSPVARTGTAGQFINGSRTRYEPYGAAAAGTLNPDGVGFTGHVNDVDTGLVYMQQRYYEPIAGRFLSVDPVTTDAKSGRSFNRYVYGNNNPYLFVDPDGRDYVFNSGVSFTLFKGTGLGVTGSSGKEMQGFSVSFGASVNLSNPQIALSVAGNELSGKGLFVGGGVVVGGSKTEGPMQSGTSPYRAAEAGVGAGPSVSGQVTASPDGSVGGSAGTKLGAGAGAYAAEGAGNQTTLSTPALGGAKTPPPSKAAESAPLKKEESK
ncbi:MAG: RHS repeat-associated core domain-containing protein, partial [Rubrivivax sp.]|nr:RHS repeat-associated core domain-containing protein [Rubrivivax sp.]